MLISKAMTVPITHSKARLLGAESDLTLVIPHHWPGYTSELLPKVSGFTLEQLPIYFPGKHHFHLYSGLGKLLRQYKPDLVHIDEEPYSLVTSQALFLSRQIGAKVIAFTWQNILKNYPPPFAQMEQYVYRNASAIIAGNQEAIDILKIKGYRGLTPLIPQFGIESGQFSPQLSDKTRYLIDTQTLAVTYVGRLVPEKGVDTLIEAIGQQDNMTLYIVGNGPDQLRLEQLASKYPKDRIRFLGGMASTDIARFMASVEVLVLPSKSSKGWKEQFGRVLIEAMASGVVPVGSDSGEIPHVIGEAGLVFPEGNVSVLTQQLKRLHDPALRVKLVEKGLERAQQFTQAKIVQATLEVYKQVLQ